MKIEKYISIISILMTGYIITKKIIFDIDMYINISENDHVAAGSIIFSIYELLLIPLALILSIIGVRKKSILAKFGLYFYILGIIYFLIWAPFHFFR